MLRNIVVTALVGSAMIASMSAVAEPSFNQVEGLISAHQYAAAESGLEVIIQHHPHSAKAYYAMSQAEAGLGNNEQAQTALDKAKGFDPDLQFAPSGNVQNLQQAIVPQTEKIQPIEESHFWRDLFITFTIIGVVYLIYRRVTQPSKRANQFDSTSVPGHSVVRYDSGHSNYTNYARSPETGPTIINNQYSSSNNSDGLLTGVLVGEMLAHDRNDNVNTYIIEHDSDFTECVDRSSRPSSSRDSDSSSRPSSSRDSDSSSSPSSSSWDSDSSSSSSSSWD